MNAPLPPPPRPLPPHCHRAPTRHTLEATRRKGPRWRPTSWSTATWPPAVSGARSTWCEKNQQPSLQSPVWNDETLHCPTHSGKSQCTPRVDERGSTTTTATYRNILSGCHAAATDATVRRGRSVAQLLEGPDRSRFLRLAPAAPRSEPLIRVPSPRSPLFCFWNSRTINTSDADAHGHAPGGPLRALCQSARQRPDLSQYLSTVLKAGNYQQLPYKKSHPIREALVTMPPRKMYSCNATAM